MIGRIIEAASDGRYLLAYRGFMVVKEGSKELARVALDDIAANALQLKHRAHVGHDVLRG